MKIFVVMHVFNNFGGIINHNEQLCAGLKELGHDVTFAFIKPTKTPQKNELDYTLKEGYEIGVGTGYPVHQGKGWICPYYALKNSDDISRFVNDANAHDLVIWQSIFGFKNSETEKFLDWTPMIEDVTAKQIVVIHDGNLIKNYSWIYKFQHKFSGLACVHPSAVKSAEFMAIPRNLILNPQDLSKIKQPTIEGRENKILSLQTFKRWKRVDNLVAAVPYIDGEIIVAGDGIERNYMTSVDKCKPEYYCTKQLDPTAGDDRLNKPIWQNALNSNRYSYIGFITEQKRDEILDSCKFLLDPSWSMNYGEHFNRVLVDSMINGVVPIARNYGVSDNVNGIGEVFKPGENYLMIPHDATPKEFGDLVNKFFNLSDEEYIKIVETNNKKLKSFDRMKIAEQFINLAFGTDNAGEYETSLIGKENPEVKKIADKMWKEHFELEEVFSLDNFF
jgi:glycosyltransferase involved in cell wall biosynthesis